MTDEILRESGLLFVFVEPKFERKLSYVWAQVVQDVLQVENLVLLNPVELHWEFLDDLCVDTVGGKLVLTFSFAHVDIQGSRALMVEKIGLMPPGVIDLKRENTSLFKAFSFNF